MLGRDPAESGTGLEDGAIHRVLLVDLVSVGHDCASEGGHFGRGPSHGVGRGSNCRVGRGATGWWSVATGASDVPSVHLTGAHVLRAGSVVGCKLTAGMSPCSDVATNHSHLTTC